MLLAIAAECDLECWYLDYSTVFLNGDVEEEYVKMAPKYEEFDESGVPMVMKIMKSVFVRAHRTGGGRLTNIWWRSVSKAPSQTCVSISTWKVVSSSLWPYTSTTFFFLEKPGGARADLVEADEPLLHCRNGRRAIGAWDGLYL